MLSYILYTAYLFDPQIISDYYERDDSLLFILGWNGPQARVQTRQHTQPWKVKPNF